MSSNVKFESNQVHDGLRSCWGEIHDDINFLDWSNNCVTYAPAHQQQKYSYIVDLIPFFISWMP